jgi:pimeloyl-ACP methyl ester carboxylesterase
LAAQFVENGFPVLRFDYYGCGDSFGSSEEGTIAHWLQDVATAISHLRAKTGSARVCLVGLRLGGTLSAIIGEQRGDIESMALWDPVLNGRSYIEHLLSLQKEMLRFRPRPRRGRKLPDCADILGSPLSNFLRCEIEKIDLLRLSGKPAKNVLIVQSDPPQVGGSLPNHLNFAGAQSEHQRLQAPQLWLPSADGSLLVPTQVLQAIVSWAGRVHS